MKSFEIKEDLAAATVRYLSSKPYGEVAQLIAGFQTLQPIKPTAPVLPKAPAEPPKGK